MDAIAIVNSTELAKLRDYDGTKPELGAKLQIDQHPSKALLKEPGTVFLVAPRPKGGLWLVARLWALGERGPKGWDPHPNNTPIIDISSVAEHVSPLETRPLTPTESEIMRHVADYPTKAFVSKVPKWLLERLAKPKQESRPLPPMPKVKLPKKLQLLGEIVAAQLEEARADLRASPKKFLKNKTAFTETVQSIFEGSGDEARILREELAPWKKAGKVDTAAKRAIDDVCRGIVALAQDRERDVPKACASYRPLLDAYVPWMRELLA